MSNTSLDLNFKQSTFTTIDNIEIPEIFNQRIKCGVEKLDIFFGNGVLPGSTFTLAGMPGGGKTTFVLQWLNALASQGYKVGLASGEEHIVQFAWKAKKFNIKNVDVSNISDIDELVRVSKDYDVLVIDSFQAITCKRRLNSREHEEYCINALCNAARTNECSMGIVMHVTKAGDQRGTNTVKHAVDAVFRVDRESKDNTSGWRVFSPEKNRWGSPIEIQAFLGENGFDFVVERVINSEGEEEKSLSPKSVRKNKEYNLIESKSKWTVQEISHALDGNVLRAKWLMGELVTLGKFKKNGRGETTTWTKC